jgi:hypothetical protein
MNFLIRKSIILTLFFICIFSFSNGFGQVKKIQSGIVYYFTQYVEWPADKQQGDFVIVVLGSDDITAHLAEMAKVRKVGSRKIVVKEINTISEAQDASIVFLPASMKSQLSSVMSYTMANSILLVSEGDKIASAGACIGFVLNAGKPGFEINTASVQSSNLKVSAKLTSLGTVVK